MSSSSPRKLRYPTDWIARREQGEKIVILTAYDATMAKLIARSRVDALLVGDTLGMVVQGRNTTLPVELEEVIYHARLVRRGAPDMFLIGDMPFASYQADVAQGARNAFRLFKEAEVNAVKFEGAHPDTLRVMEKLIAAGAPVMGHIGFTPQSLYTLGGYRVQGKTEAARQELIRQAGRLEEVGCFAMVLELMDGETARLITESVRIPTIGIGAGGATSGQVLVVNDLLGLDPDFTPKHAKKYMDLGAELPDVFSEFAREVQDGEFPP